MLFCFLGHLKKLTLAAKKLKDHKQCRLSNGMSNSSSHVNGEMLVISMHQKLAAEVRPYSHLPTEQPEDFQCGPASPPMKTFQSTSRSIFTNGLNLNGINGFSSPEHQPEVRQNFQQMHAAEVHAAANHLETFPPPRPKVSVKPRPVATIVAKTKRGSREIPQDIIYHEKQVAQQQQQQNDYVDGGHCNVSNYVNVHVGGDDLLLNVSPRRLPDGLGMSPSRSNTLKRPPVPAKKPEMPAVFQLSKKVDPALGDSTSEFEVSSAAAPSSLEDFPPPPFPLACEDSINVLKTMRSESNGVALAPKFKRMSHESSSSIDSNSSSDSCSLLPFAQENVGTIKQRSVDTVQQDGDMIWLSKPAQMPNDRRRHVQDVFLGKFFLHFHFLTFILLTTGIMKLLSVLT